MNFNTKYIVIILSLIIIFSISAISASENITIDNDDANPIQDQNLAISEVVDETQTVNLDASAGADEKVEIQKESDDGLLMASGEDEVLSATISVPGENFQSVRETIAIAHDGDVIDLCGKTIKGIHSNIGTNKKLTFINGVFDAGMIPQNDNDRSFFSNCVFENITFKNYRMTPRYANGFTNCELRHVNFENIIVNVAAYVIRNSHLYDVNFTNMRSLQEEDLDNYEEGANIVSYSSTYDYCNFINCTTNRHSGAICVGGQDGNTVRITNSKFINCSAGIGGAVYVHGNNLTNENFHSDIINCEFTNCHATEWGGALGSSQTYLNVEDCRFINNTAKQGSAFMVGGITHGLDGNREGHYNTIRNCYFFNNTGSEEGGAVHITGNYNTAIDCLFEDNFAVDGNGAAIYVKGYNASVIDSQFYEHKTSRGTVYIIGDNASVIGSRFEDNIASMGGAGVYVDGNNTLIENTYFENNNATVHGGAIHTHGNNVTIRNSQFISNNAIPHEEDIQNGLGGAIYIRGNDNEIISCYFDKNTARNGSAIYNRGDNLHINKGEFLENQAWSYLLITLADPEFSYYSEDNPILLNTSLVGGDNIINAIYNDGNNTDIWFHDVTYQTSKGIRTTDESEIHPVQGVENSDNGNKIYQDSREDYQILTLNVTNDETGKSVYFRSDRTGIYGNLSDILIGLPSGNYTLTANHPEDMLYKAISNSTKFRIVPQADVKVTKTVSNNNPNYLDTVTWTITVINDGPSDAENVYLKDLLPAGLVHLSDDSNGEYNAATGVWNIGFLPVRGEAVITIRTLVNKSNINITNIAVANSTTYDPNETNNKDNDTIDVGPVADLAIEKIVSNHYPKNNEEIIWTIKVTNNGPDTAVNARVYDVLPRGLQYISSDGAYDNTTNIWTIGDLANKGTVYLNIRTKVVVTATIITNIANVTSDTPDNDLTNNEDNDTIDIGHEADLEVIKTVSNSTPKYGDVITWTIKVINHGPDRAVDVHVNDNLPAGLIYISDDSNGKYDAKNGIWTIGELEGNNATVTLIITTMVNVTNTTITNIAVVNSSTHDYNESNNEDNDTIDVDPVADLAIEKTVSNHNPKQNEEIVWTIKVTNNGPDTAVNVRMTDIIPNGLELIGTYQNFTNNVWSIGNLAYNQSVELKITTRVLVTNTNITNIANVTSDTPEDDLSNNEDNATIDIGHEADLEVIKTVSNSTPNYGDEITWNITVINHGPDRAIDVQVNDKLPAGLIYISDDSNGKYDPQRGIWTIGELEANNATVTLIITTRVNVTNTSITNIAVVTSDTHDPNPDNNEDNDTTTVNPMADVEVTKLVSKSNAKFGDEITWTIIVFNHGPDTALNVIVKDNLPKGLIYISDDSNGKYNPTTGIWNVGSLVHNRGLTLNILTSVNVTNTNITNVAVANSTTYDPNETNNEGNNTTEINPEADVEVIKVVSNSTPKYGDEITWTITVINHGPDKAENVIVKDNLPAGLVYSGDDSNGKYDKATGIWKVGDLAHNGEAILVIKTLVNITNATITNVAVVNSTTYDSNKTNNEDNDTIEVDPVADLAIEKIVSNHYPKNGEEVTWTIKVTNNGPDTAVNARVYDVLPAGLEFVSTDGAYNNSTNIWTIGNLKKNETVSLKIITKVTVTATNITNIANVTSDTPDNDLTNNEDNDIIDVGHEADLEVIKAVSNSTPKYGDVITWNITVINHGPDKAINVHVNDGLPKGLIYISDDSNGKYDAEKGIWTIGELEGSNATVTLIITTKVNVTNTTITNIAVVNSSTHDNNESNNEDNDTITVGPVVDLEIIKTVNNHTPKKDDEVVWTIKVINHGPDMAVNVRVTDVIPNGLELIGTYENYTGNVWTIGDLAKGQSAELKIKTKVLQTNIMIKNIANVTSDTPEDDLSNNEDHDIIDVGHEADLEVIKTVSNSTPNYGDVITWNITVINHGPDKAVEVVVNDKLPTGLIYISDDSNGKYDADKGIWSIGDLEGGNAKVTLIITTKVNITNATITNIAVVSSDTYDSNESNNEDNDTADVPPVADIEVTKTVSKTQSKYGDTITWTITVFNHGPDIARNVVVKDKLPNGLVYVSDDGDGAYDPATGIWNVGDLDIRRGRVLNIVSLVNITNTNITNVAVGNTTTYDPNKTNDEGNDTTEVEPRADLVVVKIVSNATARFNETVIWTLNVTNKGPDTAVNVRVIDKLPAGLIFKSSDGNYNQTTGVWNVGNLTKGESRLLKITTIVNTTDSTIVNVANVTSDTPGDKTNGTNETTVPGEADLSIVKLVSKNITKKGEEIIWTIIVTNNGPNDASEVYIRDVLPNELIFNNKFTVTRGTFNRADLVWHIPLLRNNHSETLTLHTIVNATNKNLTNYVNVTSDTYDPNETNNEAENTTEAVPEADLVIIKTVNNSTPMKGDTVTWTLLVINKGPDSAVNVVVSDNLPNGISLVNGGRNVSFTLSVLESGKNYTYTFQTVVEISNVNITNIANVTSDTYDPNETNNEDNDTVEVIPEADLVIIKTVNNSTPMKGDTVTWTLVVINKGPDSAVNVVVSDNLPNGIRLVNGGSNVSFTIALLEAGKNQTFAFETVVEVSDADITNIANVTSDTYDPNETNNEDNETIEVPPISDLVIVKTVSNSTPRKGDVIVWTISVTNNGPDNAKEVLIEDVLPNGLTFISGDVSRNNNRIYKLIDKIAKGETVNISFKTRVDVTNVNITNIAVVSSNKTYDPNETNNEDNETISVDPEADISITKTVSNPKPKKGDLIVWTIKVTNNGPDTAFDVVVTEQLPEGLHLTKAVGSKGSFEGNVWKIGNLTKGQSATLELTTRVLISNGRIANIVVVNSSTYDPNQTNNNDTEIIVVEEDDGGNSPVPADDDDDSGTDSPSDKGSPVNNPPKSKMHATGNPIVIVLLALLAVCGITLRRKN